MPKISKDSLEPQQDGGIEFREGEIGDYTVDFLSFTETRLDADARRIARRSLCVPTLGRGPRRKADLALRRS